MLAIVFTNETKDPFGFGKAGLLVLCIDILLVCTIFLDFLFVKKPTSNLASLDGAFDLRLKILQLCDNL